MAGKVSYLRVDRMNYHYGTWVYARHGLEEKLTDEYFQLTKQDIASQWEKLGIDCRIVF
jgi:hypothetical protein